MLYVRSVPMYIQFLVQISQKLLSQSTHLRILGLVSPSKGNKFYLGETNAESTVVDLSD